MADGDRRHRAWLKYQASKVWGNGEFNGVKYARHLYYVAMDLEVDEEAEFTLERVDGGPMDDPPLLDTRPHSRHRQLTERAMREIGVIPDYD